MANNRLTGSMLDWGTGGDEYDMTHPGMDGVDYEMGYANEEGDVIENEVVVRDGLWMFNQEISRQNPLPMPDGSYHIIRLNNALYQWNCEDEDAFAEMKRLLAPQGTIIITDSTWEAEEDVLAKKREITEDIYKHFDSDYYITITFTTDAEQAALGARDVLAEDSNLYYTIMIRKR